MHVREQQTEHMHSILPFLFPSESPLKLQYRDYSERLQPTREGRGEKSRTGLEAGRPIAEESEKPGNSPGLYRRIFQRPGIGGLKYLSKECAQLSWKRLFENSWSGSQSPRTFSKQRAGSCPPEAAGVCCAGGSASATTEPLSMQPDLPLPCLLRILLPSGAFHIIQVNPHLSIVHSLLSAKILFLSKLM